MIAYVVNGVIGLASNIDLLTQQRPVVTSTDVAYFPEFSIASLGSQIGTATIIASSVAYVLTWIGSVKLLYPYIKKMGKIKFWTIMGAADGILSCIISSSCLRILYTLRRCRRNDKHPHFFTRWNFYRDTYLEQHF